MNGYYYLDISIIFDETSDDEILDIYVKAVIESKLKEIFGEIGGITTVDLIKFDNKLNRAIIRCPEQFYVKLRSALTLCDSFQGSVCKFEINCASPVLLGLLETKF